MPFEMLELLRYHIEFAGWANARALSAASALTADELEYDFKTSEHCIRSTLVHIYRSDRIWFERVQGRLADYRVEGDDTMLALAANWPLARERWREWSQALTEKDVLAEVTYKDLQGNTWTQAIWKIILHVVNHATHHRGQAMGFIRALGHTPPNVDSIMFARQQRAIQ